MKHERVAVIVFALARPFDEIGRDDRRLLGVHVGGNDVPTEDVDDEVQGVEDSANGAPENQVFTRTILDAKDLDVESPDEIRQLITDRWTAFVTTDLPAIIAAFDSEAWLWAQPSDVVP